jgi:hypothetical protein
MSTTMGARDLRTWAKEEVRDALKALLKEFKEANPGHTVDELEALRTQANMALRAIRMPPVL